MRRIRWVPACALAGLMVGAPLGLVAQDSKTVRAEDAFKAGMDADGKKNWPEAAKRLREAIAANSQESTKEIGKRFGMVGGNPYLPHHFLGNALSMSRDCEAALSAWDESRRQGVLPKTDYGKKNVKQIDENYRSCETTVLKAAGEKAEAAIHVAEAAAKTLDDLKTKNPSAWTPEFQDQQKKAGDELQSARTRHDAGQAARSRTDLADSLSRAESAHRSFVETSTQLDKSVRELASRPAVVAPPAPEEKPVDPAAAKEAELRAASAAKLREADIRVQSVIRRLKEGTKLTPAVVTEIEDGVAAARAKLNTVRRNVTATDPKTLRGFDQTLTAVREDLAKLELLFGVPILPDTLKDGAQLFFDGRYDDALKALDAADGTEMPLKIHVHVFRAAALFALFEYSAGTKPALRTRAREEVEAARILDPAFAPPRPAFSPRFIAFFMASDKQP